MGPFIVRYIKDTIRQASKSNRSPCIYTTICLLAEKKLFAGIKITDQIYEMSEYKTIDNGIVEYVGSYLKKRRIFKVFACSVLPCAQGNSITTIS
jgi:hypothetical protein